MEKGVTMSTEPVPVGVMLAIMDLGVKENVLQCSMEEIVRRAAVGIVPCQKHVTERPVCVLVVVQRDRNLLCVMKNVMT